MLRKLRNTARFMLGNLADFTPDAAVGYDALQQVRFNFACRLFLVFAVFL